MVAAAVALVEVSFDAFYDLRYEHFFFLDEGFVALLVDDCLEQHKNMFFLVFCQES